jgi:hypothetical protein
MVSYPIIASRTNLDCRPSEQKSHYISQILSPPGAVALALPSYPLNCRGGFETRPYGGCIGVAKFCSWHFFWRLWALCIAGVVQPKKINGMENTKNFFMIFSIHRMIF